MKVFKSLNCVICESPFVPIANRSRSPTILECGEAMCNECFKNEAKRCKHQCEWVYCLENRSPAAYFLFDILSQDSLVLSPMFGYILIKPMQIPECFICHEEFSIDVKEKSPMVFDCSHTICTSCYHKIRTRDHIKGWNLIRCSCQETSFYDDEFENQKNSLREFLAELPEMTRQMEQIHKTKFRVCEECNELDSIERMFYCEECQKGICGACGLGKHRSHETPKLLKNEAKKMSDELEKLSANEIETYKGIFPEMHKELVEKIDTFKVKLLSTEEALKREDNFEDLKEKHDKCILLKKDFETASEEYMPSLRKYDAKVTDLIERLDQDLGY